MISDIIQGMMYLHLDSPPVLHKDLKAANVLVNATFEAKVSGTFLRPWREIVPPCICSVPFFFPEEAPFPPPGVSTRCAISA